MTRDYEKAQGTEASNNKKSQETKKNSDYDYYNSHRILTITTITAADVRTFYILFSYVNAWIVSPHTMISFSLNVGIGFKQT